MRIAVTIKSTAFHKGFGGLETQNKLLCEGLVAKGHSVTVFAPKNELEDRSKTENGVNYVFLPVKVRRFAALFGFTRNTWQKQLVPVFLEIHSKQPFDILISQSSSGLPIIKQKKELGLKVISISHGTKIGEFQTNWSTVSSVKDFFRSIIDLPHVFINFFTVQRSFIHGSDLVVAVSNYVKKALIDETFVDENKVRVIHNGIDTNLFEGITRSGGSKEKDRVTLLYVGQVTKQKGIFSLINLMKEKDFENFRLEVVGGGTDFEGAQEMAKKLNLADKIAFLGKLKYEEVLNLYSPERADIFVFPTTRKEGFPMVLPEAMLGSLPIIAYSAGGVSDAIDDGVTGFLVPLGNLEIFKKKVLELGLSYEKRKELGENARIKALNEFSLSTMIENYEKVILEVLK